MNTSNFFFGFNQRDFRPLLLGMLAFLLTFFVTTRSHAQSNNNHIMVGIGMSYERGLDASIAYEHGIKYHNAWEYFGAYHIKYEDDPVAGHITKDSFWNSYNSWHLGVCYKPCVTRGRNHHGNVRLGVSGGSDSKDFICGIHVGYEHSFALKGGWELFFQIKEDVIIPRSSDLFRTGAMFGVKVPL